MEQKLYVMAGKRKKLARKVICKTCGKEILVRNTVPHSGYCKICWGKVCKFGRGDTSGLEGRKTIPRYKRICPDCGSEKPVYKKTEENKKCRPCNAKSNAWKPNGRSHPGLNSRRSKRTIKETKTQYTKRVCLENKTRLIKIFGDQCWVCKTKNLPMVVYEFHHIDRKNKESRVSSMLKQRNFEKIMAEAEKCKMVCSNCHKIIHYGDRRVAP